MHIATISETSNKGLTKSTTNSEHSSTKKTVGPYICYDYKAGCLDLVGVHRQGALGSSSLIMTAEGELCAHTRICMPNGPHVYRDTYAILVLLLLATKVPQPPFGRGVDRGRKPNSKQH